MGIPGSLDASPSSTGSLSIETAIRRHFDAQAGGFGSKQRKGLRNETFITQKHMSRTPTARQQKLPSISIRWRKLSSMRWSGNAFSFTLS